MEYFLGSVITLAILFVLERRLSTNKIPAIKLRYSQSRAHSLFPAPRSVHYYDYNELKTQATQHSSSQKQNQVRVVLHENDAYWIADNTLFTAKLSGDDIDRESTKIVDTMALDKVELNKLMIIVDKLTEGNSKNDNGNPGNKGFF